MMALDRASILAHRDLPREEVQVPEWGGSVWVRTLSGAERDSWESSNIKMVKGEARPDLRNLRARLCVLVVCDEAGHPLFQAEDHLDVGRLSARALDRIYDVARRLNGIGDEDLEDARGN